MHLSAIAAAILLPLAAMADGDKSTITLTNYMTLTKTITLARVAVTNAPNSTVSLTTPTLKATATTGTSLPTNAGSTLGGAQVAFVAVAGAAVAVFL